MTFAPNYARGNFIEMFFIYVGLDSAGASTKISC